MKDKAGIDYEQLYVETNRRLEALTQENELYKQRSPIIGVRWYGEGGFGIGLTNMINGQKRVALEGYGDKKVIDFSTWLRIRGTEEAQAGILVRDDTVIEELGFVGIVAEKDKRINPNAYTDEQIVGLLAAGVKQLKAVANNMTHHFAPKHFLDAAKRNGITERDKLHVFKYRHRELFTRFTWSLLNVHDLKLACELNKVRGYDEMAPPDMINALVKNEMAQTEED